MSFTLSSFYILNNGTVKACGANNYGQLGIGNTTGQTSLVTVPISNVRQVACGSDHTVFLLNDGTVKACGNNSYGQLGIGNTTQQNSPVTVPISNVKQVACGGNHTVFLLNDGTVKACGRNDYGQLGIGNTNQTSPVTVPISNVKQIVCGYYYTVFLLNDGTVKACGRNDYGQLGIGNTTQQNSLVTVPVSNVKQIACGDNYTVYLLNDGTVEVCGYNGYGQLGIGNTTNKTSPVTVPISNVKQVVCGYYYTVYLLNDGTVKACGANSNGQLGISNTTQQNSPVTVPISNVKQIACGGFHTIFLLNDGTVKACGRNDYGQLGISNTTQQNSLVTVPISNVYLLFDVLILILILGNYVKKYAVNSTYISQNNVEENYSTASPLQLGGGNQILLKTNAVENIGYVVSAKLQVNVNTVATAGEISLVKLLSNWDINTVTYQTSPVFDTTPITVNTGGIGSYTIDIKDILSEYGIAVYTNSAVMTIDKNITLEIEYAPTEIVYPYEIKSSGVYVSWKPVLVDERYYSKTILKRSTAPDFKYVGGETVFETNNINILSCIDTNVEKNTNYYYKVFVEVYATEYQEMQYSTAWFEVAGMEKTNTGYMLDGSMIYFVLKG